VAHRRGALHARSLDGVDPIVIYAGFVVIALLVLALAMLLSPPAKRRCPNCEREVALGARACRCGYAFA
jgi:hypothetical protein